MSHPACIRIYVLGLFILALGSDLTAQTVSDTGSKMASLIALRDQFIAKIEALGYHPRLNAPQVVMDNPPSFGNYDDSTNTLHTSDWKTLPDEDKQLFVRSGKRYGYSGEDYFESSAHRWIFIHELGHWWRACQRQETDSYSSEMAADRIDIAYWREADTAYSAFSRQRFENYLKTIPNPVPPGQDKQKYLNENYGKLPVPVYIWYQATTIVDGYNETPIATFKETIVRSGNRK